MSVNDENNNFLFHQLFGFGTHLSLHTQEKRVYAAPFLITRNKLRKHHERKRIVYMRQTNSTESNKFTYAKMSY